MRYLYGLMVSAGWAVAAGTGSARELDIPPPVAQAEQERIAAISRAIPAAVSIFTPDGNGGGSGVVISADGYALSNYHVTSPVGDYLRCGMSDGRMYDAVIVGIDPTGDVALIKLLGRNDFPAAELADSDQVRVGDWCFAVGNPFLLATDFQPSVTYGIVSGVHRYQYPAGSILEYADCIQTDAAINPGNSGGPLFDARGQLIGIVGRGSFEKRGRVNVGVGYAISINQVKNFLGVLHSGRVVDHATLGATVNRDERGRVIVSNILNESDAHRRGLRYGDELLSFGGRSIESVNSFKNVLGIFPQGWRVPLSYRREDRRYDTFVRLAGVHTQAELMELLEREPIPKQGPDEKPSRKPSRKQPGKPPPGKQPPGSPPGDAPPPDAPPRSERSPGRTPVVVPAEAAKLIQPKSGYKNYYFNELNRDRVWNRLVAGGGFQSAGGSWTIRGQVAAGGELTGELASDKSQLEWPGTTAQLTESRELHDQLEPGETGLLLALHLWRRVLILGPARYGAIAYVGRAPLPGREGLYDVLSATRDVTESLLYFDPSHGRLAAMELFHDYQVDPCELLFDDYRAAGTIELPHRITARRGTEVFVELRISGYEIQTTESEERQPLSP
jgi:S1-C subfamily serine protease